jgi:hypothetical protein
MLVSALALCGVAWCAAQEPGKGAPAKPMAVEVMAIRATTKSSEISPELKAIADKLKSQFKFTGFKLERRASGNGSTDKPYTAALVGGYSVRVAPRSKEGKRVQLEVKVLRGDQTVQSATVTVTAGQSQLFGGMPLEGGDQLIVAVAAR